MAWRTLDEVQVWIDENGGLEGGGFEALRRTIDEGRFGEGRMPMAIAYRDRELAHRQERADAEVQQREDAQRREVAEFARRNTEATERAADTGETQANAASGASLGTWALAVLALAALIATLVGLLKG